MSAMIKTRTRLTHPFPDPHPVKETEAGVSRHPAELKHGDDEPPEEAIREEEGPESWQEWRTEAPDAGRGEYLSIERDFTHGRSRS